MTPVHAEVLRSLIRGEWITINGKTTPLGEVLENIEAQSSGEKVLVSRSAMLELVQTVGRLAAMPNVALSEESAYRHIHETVRGWLSSATTEKKK